MSITAEIAALIQRDLTRLLQQLEAFPDEAALWQTVPGVTNSAGNLILHLEGNLREYVGRRLGGLSYLRQRDLEFTLSQVSIRDLAARIEELRGVIPQVIEALSPQQLEADYPDKVLGLTVSTRQFLIHLYGHLNWHLGQIDYLRRFVTGGKALDLARLQSRE
jgi:hypothetical protein